MKEHQQHKPPQWAQKFLEWYCRPEKLEDLQGDLNEYFQRHCENKSPRKAKLIYVLDVFKFFRSYTVRKPDFINYLIHWIMLSSYIKTSGRSIVRHKLFSALNIVGLAISMSVGLLLIGLLSDMTSYDKFHKNGERIYRVVSKYQYLEQIDENYYASTSLKAGKDIQEKISGIEEVAILYSGLSSDVKAEEKTIPLKGLWATESFFSVFNFSMIEGDATSALKNPFSIVLTETSAQKLFGSEDAMGKVLTLYKDQQYTVTGIIKDVPKFSHLQFQMLVSLSTRETTEQKRFAEEMAWDNMWQGYVYVLLPEKPAIQNLQDNLDKLCAENNKTVKNVKIKLGLQPLNEIALGEDMNNSIGPVMSSSEVWMISLLSFVVLISACFNYTNLSIARSLRRSKEVGIRKVIGALKSHVLGQFIVEAVLISVLAFVLALGLFVLLKPYFLSLQPKFNKMLELDLSFKTITYFIGLAVGTGILAGFLPAVFFSRINAIQVLKGSSTFRAFKNVNMRKALIVLQYTISLMFITATIIGIKQYRHFVNFDLGYSTENILNIDLQDNKADLLAKELAEIPEIQGMSRSLIITSLGNYWGVNMKYIDPMDSTMVYYNAVDENYLTLHKVKLIAGRNFTPKAEKSEESEVIINEETMKRFKIGKNDPLKALDEIVTVNRKNMKIIGVIKDFHYGKADSEVQEVILRYEKEKPNFINAKVMTNDWLATLSKIERAWKKVDDVHPLEAEFYNEKIKQSFTEISAMLKIMGFLAFLAICIASMGLLGMVVFTTEMRLKEISIRKVLGASEGSLIYLLSKGFMLLLFFSAFIALPVTYLFFEEIALPQMPNHAPISVQELLWGLIAVMVVASCVIGSFAFKAARSNPAEILKNE